MRAIIFHFFFNITHKMINITSVCFFLLNASIYVKGIKRTMWREEASALRKRDCMSGFVCPMHYGGLEKVNSSLFMSIELMESHVNAWRPLGTSESLCVTSQNSRALVMTNGWPVKIHCILVFSFINISLHVLHRKSECF